jgi:hypothetical protein
MLRGTPAMAPTALAGTPFTMNAMPGPLPMPMSTESEVRPCWSLASPLNAEASTSMPCLAKMPIWMPTSSGVKVQANATALPTRSFSAALAGATSASARIAAAALETARRMRGMVSSLWRLTARPWSKIIAENHRSRHAARMPVACATEP